MSNNTSFSPDYIPDETQRRSQLVLRTLPILLIQVFVTLAVGLYIRLTLGDVFFISTPGIQPGNNLWRLAPPVVLVIFFISLITLVRLGRPTTSALLLIGIWTLGTTMAILQDGVTAVVPALLLVPICVAGLLIDGVASISLAFLSSVLVFSLAWLEVSGLSAPRPLALLFPSTQIPIISAGFWTALFWIIAGLTSLLAGGLQKALTQSRAQALALRELSAQLEARVTAQTAELAQRAARAEALHDVSRALASTLDLTEVLALITEHAARLLHFDSAMVLLETIHERRFTQVGDYHASSSLTEVCPEAEPILWSVLEARQPEVVRIPLHDLSCKDSILALALPMRYGERVAGLLLLSGGEQAQRSADDLKLAEGLADQAAVAIANAQLLAESRESATLEERTRLAREIHDTLAQGLTGVVVQLGAAQRALATVPAEAGEHLDLAQRMARESLAEARRSVWNLRAPALERGDLADALSGLVARPMSLGTVTMFEQQGKPWVLPPSVESALLRVCQEALSNIAKHADATEAKVVLAFTPQMVCLSITDNGVGFDEETLSDKPVSPGPWGGFGLLGMRERIAALGGTLDLRNYGGAQVVATIPRREV